MNGTPVRQNCQIRCQFWSQFEPRYIGEYDFDNISIEVATDTEPRYHREPRPFNCSTIAFPQSDHFVVANGMPLSMAFWCSGPTVAAIRGPR